MYAVGRRIVLIVRRAALVHGRRIARWRSRSLTPARAAAAQPPVLRAIVTTSSARLPLNPLSTQSTGAVRVVRTVLGAGGYRIVGIVNVPDMQTHAEVPAAYLHRTVELGRGL